MSSGDDNETSGHGSRTGGSRTGTTLASYLGISTRVVYVHLSTLSVSSSQAAQKGVGWGGRVFDVLPPGISGLSFDSSVRISCLVFVRSLSVLATPISCPVFVPSLSVLATHSLLLLWLCDVRKHRLAAIAI